MPHPWKIPAEYDGATYDLNHMANLVREISCSDDQKRQVEFRFHYHCFTEGEKATDFRRKFTDEGWPSEKRVFCPHRWFLSLRLRTIMGGEIDRVRLIETDGFQWLYNKRVDGISKPYAIFLKFGTGGPKGPLIVNVMSAYIKTDPQLHGDEQRFDSLLTLVATTGKIPGRR